MEIRSLSSVYTVRRLVPTDVEQVFALCAGNPAFYRHHPPFVTRESILEDLEVLPPGKERRDKLFVGFFAEDGLIAVMDLILDYPGDGVAYIGLFMLRAADQGRGVATALMGEIADCLRGWGFERIRLAIDEGNPQSEAFWAKNCFVRTGERYPNDFSTYLPMERPLQRASERTET